MTLFFLSMLVAFGFVSIGVHVLFLNKRERLNLLAAAEYFIFAWWSFFYALVYIAPTAEEAMLWHRLAAFGWGLFCPVATHFFFRLSRRKSSKKVRFYYPLLYILPAAIISNALFNPAGTSVTADFLQVSGVGWVYQTNIHSIWYWLYILNITLYFSICLKGLYSWARNSGRRRSLLQARSVLLLNIVVLVFGAFWELVLPVLYPSVPPACHFVGFLWGLGFLYIIKSLKLTSLEDAATPDVILKTVVDPILVLDSDGIIIKCNNATATLLKLPVDHILNRPLSDFFTSGVYNAENVAEIFTGKLVQSVKIDLMDSTGEVINTTASFSLAKTKLDGLIGIVASFHDVTELKKIETELIARNEKNLELTRQLELLANNDALTGLPNRRLLWSKLEKAIDAYRLTGTAFALFFIDLDGFKKINDNFGHDVGDKLLQRSAQLMKAIIRKHDVLARIGGDEFVILFTEFDDPFIEVLLTRLKSAFAEPIIIDGSRCTIGLSIGISKCPEDGLTGSALMKCADDRMYEEKQKHSH